MDSFVLHPSAAQTRPPGYVRLARGSSRMRAPRYAESDIDRLLASVRTSPRSSRGFNPFIRTNRRAGSFPGTPDFRRTTCLSAALEPLKQDPRGARKLHDPGGEAEVLPKLHRAPVGGEGLELDPADPPIGREPTGLVDQLPAHAPAPVAGAHDHARELEGPLVREPGRGARLPVGHPDDLAVLVLGDQDHRVGVGEGLVVLGTDLVVEAGARGEDPPVGLHPI